MKLILKKNKLTTKCKKGKLAAIKKLLFIWLLTLGLFAGIAIRAESSIYSNFEEIPGQERTTDLITYLESVYKFGIGISAMLALFMISLGAFAYIVTSAGNTAKMADAKSMITEAFFGLILALTGYLILFVINPDLVSGTLGGPRTTVEELLYEGGNAGGAKKDSVYQGYKNACPSEKMKDDTTARQPIDFSQAPPQGISSKCHDFDKDFKAAANQYGVDACTLMAIAQMESSCNPNAGPSDDGACGLMQLLPKTASQLTGEDVTCDKLKKDVKFSINVAAQYIKKNQNNKCVTDAHNDLSAIFAGYNSGYGCDGGACSPQKHALCESSDCDNALAFECCINPGELDEAIGYAWNGMGLYKDCKGKYQ